MDRQEKIRNALLRRARIVKKREAAAKTKGVTTARIRRGLTCEIRDGQWSVTADQPASFGGGNQGPDPGFFGRGALAACLAQGYAMWFAREGVPVDGIEVRVEATGDARGILGVSEGVGPGYESVSCVVEIDSNAGEARIREVMDLADRHSPWLRNFTTAVEVSRTLRVRHR